MIKTYIQYAFFICLFSTNAFSQKKDVQSGDPNDLDEKFVPDKSSVLNSINNSPSTSSGHREGAVKNIVNFNLTLLGRGAAAVFWEHPFGKVVSVEGGLGLCFDKDYMQGLFAGAFAESFDEGNASKYVPLSTLLTGATFAGGPSAYLSGGIKLYFSDDAPDGSYFSFNMRYYANNLQINPSNSPQLNGSPDITVRNLGFNILYGYQVVGGGKNVSLVNDFYFGVGLRRTAYDGIQVNSGTNINTGAYQTTWTPDGTTQTNLAPVFLIGYCLGFGF